MRIKPGYIVLTAAGVALGLQVVLIRQLVKTSEAIDELGSMMLFNLQREFQEQVDEEFVAIVEENFNDD